MTNSETGEVAAVLLEGGLRAVLEGLDYSEDPCAEVLSVAGFFDLSSGFPGWERVYSEGKEASFCLPGPSLLQLRD